MDSLDLTKNPTQEQFAKLLASRDDDACSHVITISKHGILCVVPMDSGMTPVDLEKYDKDMLCRFETLERGNGYVGEEAVKDNAYVSELFMYILKAWRVRHPGYIGAFSEIVEREV